MSILEETQTVLGPLAGTVSFTLGVLSHILVFRFGEWDLATLKLIALFPVCFGTSTYLIAQGKHPIMPHAEGLQAASASAASHYAYIFAGLYTSMLIYRGFFHRLSKYPGPFLARFSGLYMTIYGMRTMKTYEDVQKLHAKYGDVVRLGKYHQGNSYRLQGY